ncbi:MAG TPA: transglycosylase family protein [Solirubrobacterales bacterium]|nr:transglycosylase family protein [Solirubrobacterales bacterium]
MLIKRSHIAYIVLALLAFPAAALAAGGGGVGPAIGPAQPALAPLQAPALSFQRTIEAVQAQIRADHRADLRRQAREEREAFESLPGGVSLSTLESIASCESGGDPTVVSSDGSYRGKYQFDYGTWESVGGSGDPAAASEIEQDYRAALLYSRAGSSPWPICG